MASNLVAANLWFSILLPKEQVILDILELHKGYDTGLQRRSGSREALSLSLEKLLGNTKRAERWQRDGYGFGHRPHCRLL